jgi:dipeptidyl aminopeptidase/acylaminoacyl peptidase
LQESSKLKSIGWAVAASVFALAGASRAEPTNLGIHNFGALALSPDGARVATIDTFALFTDAAHDAHGHVAVRNRAGVVVAVHDPCPTCRYSGLAWSPDGKALALIASDPKAHTAALDVIRDGKAATLAVIDGVAERPRWSPDGQTLALQATAGAHKLTGAVEAGAPQVGDIDAVETQDEQRIAVVSAAGGALRYVSPADTFVYEYDWTPDGRGFVATAAKGNGDNNWWVAKLVGIDLASGAARVIAEPKLQMDFPRVSPDGKTVAFIGGLMSDFGAVGGDIYTVPLSGGAPTDITPGYHGTFTSLARRGQALYGSAQIGDQAAVFRLDPKGGVSVLRSAPDTLSAGDGEVSFSADGALGAAVVQDFTHAPELAVGPLTAMAPVTHENAGLLPQVSARSVAWKSDGFDVQGWLIGPPAADTSKLHPMVVVIHGGPSSATTPTYVSAHPGLFAYQELVAKGYYFFMPNPRGSYGQGEAFTAANKRDFGGGDLRDILAGVDAVEKIAPIDDKRLGVAGHSYGGFMTMWTVTHSHRFHAAIAGAGLSDWISYYGENGIDQWMTPFFGATAYDDPAIYEKLSPIYYIKNAHTPTFIYVGERDVECPAPQSFEFFRGLQAMGTPASLVVYAGQGHAIRDPADLVDLHKREAAWLDKYLGS